MRRSTGFVLGAVAAGAIGWALWAMLAAPSARVEVGARGRGGAPGEPAGTTADAPASRAAAIAVRRTRDSTTAAAASVGGVVFTGTVIDAEGGPVAGALVELGMLASPRPGMPGAASAIATARTRADGTFDVDGFDRGATHVLRITHIDVAPLERVVDRDASHDLGLLRLLPGARQRVRVVADGQPLAGARVLARATARTGGDPLGVVISSAATDGDGACVLRGLPDGPLRLTAEAAGFAPALRVILVAAARVPSAEPDVITLVLAPGAPLAGQFRGGDATGLAVIARHVRHADGSTGPPEIPSLVAPLAADGTFQFPAVARGLWRVALLAGDRPISLEHELETDAPPGTWEMPAVGTLHLTITAGGTPTSALHGGVRVVAAHAPPGTTGSYAPWRAGVATMHGLPAGLWDVDVLAAGHPAVIVPGVSVVAGGTTEAAVAVPEGGALDVAVTDDSGAVVDGARVSIREALAAGGRVVAEAVTGPDGRALLAGLPAGACDVVVEADRAGEPGVNRGVVVEDGGRTAVPVVVARGGTIEGTVRDSSGRPDAAAAVDATRLDVPGRAPVRRGTTDAAGRYRIQGLAPGRWRVRCAVRAGQPAVSQADVGNEEPVVVTVSGAGTTSRDW